MAYDSPQYTVRQYETRRTATPAVAAGTGAISINAAQKRRLYAVRATVQLAGTTATHAYIVRNGTTALGTITLGSTTTAGMSTRLDITNADLAAGDVLNCLSNGDATGIADITYEFDFLPDTDPAATGT